MADETFVLKLSCDEALVLFEFLVRAERSGDLHIEDEAEQVVLANILCLLEKQLVAPFDPNYSDLLAKARSSLRPSETSK